jgi:hypothetical protein
MPRSVVVFVGRPGNADLWDFCGARRGLRRLTQSAVQALGLRLPAAGSRLGPRGWVVDSQAEWVAVTG